MTTAVSYTHLDVYKRQTLDYKKETIQNLSVKSELISEKNSDNHADKTVKVDD